MQNPSFVQIKEQQNRKKCYRSFIMSFSLILIIACFVISGFLIAKLCFHWIDTEDSVKMTPYKMQNWKIPFPAVTICSEMKIRKSLYDFTDMYHRRNSLNPTERNEYESLSLVCQKHLTRESDNTTKFTDENGINIIKSAAPDLDMVFLICLYGSVAIDCRELFKPILTEDGLCYTFNMIGYDEIFKTRMDYNPFVENQTKSKHWSLDYGYDDKSTRDVYPQRSIGSGYLTGLTLVMKFIDDDFDVLCRGTSKGFRLSLHSPADYPVMDRNYIPISLTRDVHVQIKPKITTLSKNLINSDPETRGCYYSGERKLKYFKQYTKKNCELECTSQYIYFICGCVTFAMPHDVSKPICSASNMLCTSYAQADMRERLADTFLEDDVMAKNKSRVKQLLGQFLRDCNCLPDCNSLNYDYTITQSIYDRTELYEAYNAEFEDNATLARATVYFKEDDFMAYEISKDSLEPITFVCIITVLGIIFIFAAIKLVKTSISLYKRIFRSEELIVSNMVLTTKKTVNESDSKYSSKVGLDV